MSAKRTGMWTRRQFAQTAAALAAGVSLPRWISGGASLSHADGFAFVGAVPENGEAAIHVLRTANGQLTKLSETPSTAPARLLMHPSLPVLYALHDVALWEYLPRGAVSAYRFEQPTGTLHLLGTQPLSLAATNPRNGAVFSRGQNLFVTTAAGIYNVLPLATDGSLLPVSAIRKVLGEAGTTVQVHEDSGTLLLGFNNSMKAYRLIQDEYQEIQQVSFKSNMLSRMNTFAYKLSDAELHTKVATFTPGVCSTVFHTM